MSNLNGRIHDLNLYKIELKLSDVVRVGAWTAAVALGALTVAPPVSLAALPPVPIPFNDLVKEIQAKQVEQLSFSADEKSVTLKTVDGAAQTASVLPSAGARLVDLLLQNDVPFKASFPEQPNPVGAVLDAVFNLAFPLALLFLFLGPRLFPGGMPGSGGKGGPGGGPGGMFGGDNNPFQVGKSKAELQMEPNTGVSACSILWHITMLSPP
jgi:cell division protease FtsH